MTRHPRRDAAEEPTQPTNIYDRVTESYTKSAIIHASTLLTELCAGQTCRKILNDAEP